MKHPKYNIYLAIIGASVILVWANFSVGHSWGGDFSAYIMQAVSIVEGEMDLFAEANRYTIEASSRPVGPVTYPWGYPLLLAPIYYIAGIDIVAFKYVGLIFFVLFLIVLCKYFEDIQAVYWRSALIALFAVNPTLIKFLDNVLSDIPFLFISTLVVVTVGKTIVQQKQIKNPLADGVFLGVLIFIAYSIRSNGIVLLVALGLTQLVATVAEYNLGAGSLKNNFDMSLKKDGSNKKAAQMFNWSGLISPYGSFIILLLVYHAIFPDGSSSHFSFLGNISLRSIISNAYYYVRLPADFYASPIKYILYGATLPLVAVTLIKRYKQDYHIIIYVALTFALYMVWPATQGLRFIFPVLPFYIYYTLLALESFESTGKVKIDSCLRRLVCRAPVLFLIAGFSYYSLNFASQNISAGRSLQHGPYTVHAQQMFSQVKENTQESDTVVFFKPRVMRLFTYRPSILIDSQEDLVKGDLLVIDLKKSDYSQMSEEALNMLEADGVLEKTWFNDQFVIYRIKY